MNLFANPNDVKRYLGQVWKVIKHTKVMLQSGATHTVTLNIIANKVIKQSTVDQAELDGEIALPGVTVYLIAIVRGQIVKDTLVASLTRPTFSETALDTYVEIHTYAIQLTVLILRVKLLYIRTIFQLQHLSRIKPLLMCWDDADIFRKI